MDPDWALQWTREGGLEVCLTGSEGASREMCAVPCEDDGVPALVAAMVRRRLGWVVPKDSPAQDSPELSVVLPDDVFQWLGDPRVVWHGLSGAGVGQVTDVQEISSVEAAREIHGARNRLWHCHVASTGWLILEAEPAERPSRELVRAVQRQRQTLQWLGVSPSQGRLRAVPESAVTPGVTLLRIASPARVVYIGKATVERLQAGRPMEGLALCVLHGMIRSSGLMAVMLAVPRTPRERQGRFALRAVRAMVRSGGVPARVCAETAYRSGELYHSMAVLLKGMAGDDRRSMRHVLGHRRWEQLEGHGNRIPPGSGTYRPWDAVASAALLVMDDLAARTAQRGMAPPEVAARMVRQLYLAPQSARLKEIWHTQLKSRELGELVENARLSHLRGYLRSLGRETVILAGCSEPPAVQQRLAAVYSRGGRRMYLEDVAAMEGKMARGEFDRWDHLLAARKAVASAARHARL